MKIDRNNTASYCCVSTRDLAMCFYQPCVLGVCRSVDEYFKWVQGAEAAMRSWQKLKQQHKLRLCRLAYVMQGQEMQGFFEAIACAHHRAFLVSCCLFVWLPFPLPLLLWVCH